jgi:shikimate 5-dehydrogenase
MMLPAPATRPTLYFIGVSTGRSSIMRVFPNWAAQLGLDAEIKGVDFPLHAEPAAYRAAVEFIRDDPESRGALVTSHKIDLFKACHDLFDKIDPHAAFMDETSCISKQKGSLVCHAKDPISSGLSLDGFLPPDHFAKTGAEVFSIGAGGSTIALTWHLMRRERGANVPSRIIISDRSQARLSDIARIHKAVPTTAKLDYVLAVDTRTNDEVVSSLKPGSLIINATGLGKDAPGSPLSDSVQFPESAIVWELNYRGDLIFLDQARAQKDEKNLQIEDGWTYFIHGWTQVIAEVFHVDIPTSGPEFEVLAHIAGEVGAVK